MAKEMIAMLLAGGQGSRLYALTQKLAKPAVPFGGKYRIIDFPLSNCVNSGIDTVGVLTQYQPLVLNEYIGNGQPWDLDRLHGGVHILQPYQQASGSDWYKGTANAIYQNIPFIERYDPQYVIILSGDQICKQDYSDFLRFHKEKNAEFSVAVMEVPWEEASRFGLMVADADDRITEYRTVEAALELEDSVLETFCEEVREGAGALVIHQPEPGDDYLLTGRLIRHYRNADLRTLGMLIFITPFSTIAGPVSGEDGSRIAILDESGRLIYGEETLTLWAESNELADGWIIDDIAGERNFISITSSNGMISVSAVPY